MSLNKDLGPLMRAAIRETGNRELNDRLYPLVVAGDEAARTEMIQSNMPLVLNKVQSFLSTHPQWSHLRDDLLSQGFVGVTQAVNKMAKPETEDDLDEPVENCNPTGFISLYIYHRLGELVDIEQGIRVPGRTFRRKKGNGEMTESPVKEGSLTVEDTLNQQAQVDPRAMVDLSDEILGCCETTADRSVVEYRAKGSSDEEIAAILGVCKTTVYMMRRAIYARFLARNQEFARPRNAETAE
jgi:hypothetical protein